MINYSGAMYADLNTRLRQGKGPARADKADFDAMDQAFSKAGTTEDMTVYRGVGGSFVQQLVKGTSYTDGGFTSVTSSQSIADNFARGDEGEAILEIRVPKGSKAISVKDFSQFGKAEQEIVLNRGGRFTVTDRIEGKKGKPARIIVEYIG